MRRRTRGSGRRVRAARRRGLLLLVAAMALAVAATACSGDYNRYATDAAPSSTTTSPSTTAPPPSSSSTTTVPPSQTTAPPTTAPGATTTTAAPPVGVPPGRLALVTTDGGLVTVRPDGAEVRTVTDAPAGGTVVQFAWAPDNSRLAFTTTTRTSATIGVAVLDGAPPVTRAIPTAPYHLAWNATQPQLAHLRVDSVDSVELAVSDSALATAPRRIASGAPVYGAWSPDGSRLVAKIDDSQLVLSSLNGMVTSLAVQLAPSGAPAWLDNDTIITAVQTAADRRLVLLDVDTGVRQDLLIYDGLITFIPDPAGARIAYQLTPEDSSGGGGGRVSFPTGGRRQAQGEPPSALDGVLAVHDIATGTETQVVDATVTAFQWSPDGGRLALLEPGDSGASRWRFWAGATALVDGPAFVPSQTSTQLAFPYFDQLATSTRWWSPDGSAFTFAGRVQGREGVWVVPTASGGAASFVHDGELVSWSWR